MPLRKLLTRNKKFDKLSEEERRAFNRLKLEVQDSLDHFDKLKQTHLHTDAGPDGCSAFLLQNKPIDKDYAVLTGTQYNDLEHKLIKCDSHAYTAAESNYSHIEKEALACVWAIKLNHNYLYGRHFTCHTDALAVKRIFEEDKIRKKIPLRFIRWKSELSPYNVTFVHRAGKDNIADFLSSRFKREHKSTPDRSEFTTINRINSSEWPSSITIDELLNKTKMDKQIQLIKTNIHHKRPPTDKQFDYYRENWSEFSITKEGILLKEDQIVIPLSLKQRLIDAVHEAHQGLTKTKRFLRTIAWFPNMTKAIETKITDCWPCQVNIDNTRHETIKPTQMTPHIWHTVAIDFSSMSPTGEYNLNFKDENTRRLVIAQTKRITSKAAITASEQVFKVEVVCTNPFLVTIVESVPKSRF